MTFATRTRGRPLALAKAVTSALNELDTGIIVSDVDSMQHIVASALMPQTGSAIVLGICALIAFVTSLFGTYSLAAYTVRQRTREIGIRIAMGSSEQQVVRLILGQTLWPGVGGSVAGLVGFLGVFRLLRSMVFGVAPLAIPVLACTIVCTLAIGGVAGWLAVAGGIRMEPVVAMRQE